MELTINGIAYQFKFGIGFMREMNKKIQLPVDGVPGVKRDAGLAYYVARIIDGEVDALIDVLLTANRGFDPRLTTAAIDSFVDQEDTDIEDLFDTVIDFLSKSNATKKITAKLLEAAQDNEQ